MEFSRIQKYAEAVGGELVKNALRGGYDLFYPDGYCLHADTLVPIKESLAAKYRGLAEQAQEAWRVGDAIDGFKSEPWCIFKQLTAIADELSAPEEPTIMLTKLQLRRNTVGDSAVLKDILDALIELYKAKE